AAADSFADVGVERLDADFELERSRREAGDDFAQRFGEAVGNHFKMEEESRLIAFEEKLQEPTAGAQVQVEGAVHEFEVLDPAFEQPLQLGQQFFQGDRK